MPPNTELIAATKLALAVVFKLDSTPNVRLIFEKLLSTSELVRAVPLTVAPGLVIELAVLKIIVAMYLPYLIFLINQTQVL